MSLNRYAKRRDKNEAEIVEFFRKAGLEVHLLDQPVDLLIGFPVEWVLVEVKTTKGRLKPGQVKFFEREGAPRYIVRSIEDAQEILRSHRSW